MLLTPPFSIPAGQGVIWLTPTVFSSADSPGSNSCIGGTTWSTSAGGDLNGGTVTSSNGCPLGYSNPVIEWSGFGWNTNSGIVIHNIYPVIFVSGYGGNANSNVWMSINGSAYNSGLSVPIALGQLSEPHSSDSIGSTGADVTGASIAVTIHCTSGVAGGTSAAVSAVALAVYATISTTVSFTTPTGVTITNGTDTGYIFAAPSGAPGIFNFSWLQAADEYDISNQSFPMPVDQLKAVHRKSKEYTVTGDRWEIAPVVDYNNGVIKFRLTEPPGNYPWGIGLSIQKRAPKMSKPGDVFPWPDELSFVLFEMLLWQASRICYGTDAAETQVQMQVAMGTVMAALESEDREDNTMAYAPDISFMSGTGWG